LILEFRKRDRGLQVQLKKINAELKKIGVNSGVAGAGLDRAGRKAKRFTGLMGDARTMVLGVVAALGALAARAAVGVFIGFQTEMNNVRAITNATEEEFQALTATAKLMGETTQFTARQSAAAMTFLARTGLDVLQVIEALPATMNLAAAAATDLATAADIATNVMKAMGLEVGELEGVVDILAKTTNSSNLSLIQLAEGLKLVAPVAANANIRLTELAALLGKLGDAGIQGSLAGVALRRSIINLITGTGAAGPAIERLGLRVRDSAGEFVGLIGILEQLETRVVTDTDLVDLFGVRAIAAIQVLRNTGVAGIRAFTAALDEAAGTAERMRKQQMEGLVGASKRLKSSFEATQIFLGQSMEPTLIFVAEALTFLTARVRDTVAGFQAVGVVLRVIFEAILTGVEVLRDGVAFVFSGIITEMGFVVQAAGFLARKLGLEVGESIEEAGKVMRQFGDNAMRGAGIEIEELGTNAGGVTIELEGAAGAAGRLADISADLTDNLGATNEELERQQKLLGELATTFATAMLTAAEQFKGGLTVLRRELEKSGVEITEAMEAQFEALFEKAEEALREERAKAIAKGFRDAVQRELEQIEFSAIGATTDEDRVVLLERQRLALQAQIDLAQERLDLGVETEEEERALIKLILEFNRAMGSANKEQLRLLETIKKGGQQSLKDLQSTLRLISQAVDGVLDLAKAFGVVNDTQAETIRNLKNIAEGAATAARGFAEDDSRAAVAGGLQFLGGIAGLFSAGNPTEDAVKANTEAMFLLADQMEELGRRVQSQSDQLSRALALTRRTVTRTRGVLGIGARDVIRLTPAEFREIFRAAQAVGLSLPAELLERAARGQDVVLGADIAAQLGSVLEDVLGVNVAADAEGLTQSVTRSVAVTELQANQLLAFQSSQLAVLEDILAVLSGGTGFVSAPAVAGGGGVVTIQIGPNEIILGGGGTTEQAEQLVDEVLQIAGNRLANQDQLLGVRR
jgi:TP901 family phage tail tape measure protein